MGLQRRLITFAGSVQGVGFRYTACRLAPDYDVTGYVRNAPDGTVELVAEGDRDRIDQFLAAIQRRLSSHIRNVMQQTGPHQNEFRGFGVRY